MAEEVAQLLKSLQAMSMKQMNFMSRLGSIPVIYERIRDTSGPTFWNVCSLSVCEELFRMSTDPV